MTLVKDLPGCSTPFTLGKYKRDLLKPYSKIYFWLCSREDFGNSTFDDADRESEDDAQLMCSAFSPSDEKSSPHSVPTKNVSIESHNTPSSSHSPLPSGSGAMEKYLVSHQCPTCYKYYSREQIEIHADICAESWIDTIGECAVVLNLDDEQQDLENQEISAVDQMDFPERLEAMKGVLETLKANVKNTSVNRIAIRRRFLFTDYMEARLKKYFKPQGLLKVSFTGEPAIDGGGPRREFFTGNTAAQYYKQHYFETFCHLLSHSDMTVVKFRLISKHKFMYSIHVHTLFV
jgi:hypothetical protein